MKEGPFRTKLTKKLGPKLTEAELDWLEQAIANQYAHPTEPGWCCACDADIAFLEGQISDALVAISKATDMQGVKDAIMVEKLRLRDTHAQ